MPSLRKTLYAMIAAAGYVNANSNPTGPSFKTGPPSSGTFIREAVSTLILPGSPSGSTGNLIISAGMDTTTGDDLIRFLATSSGGQWDVLAYTLIKTPAHTKAPIPEPKTAAAPGDHITMHYLYNDATRKYTQFLLINGKQVSNLTASSGDAESWGGFVTCQGEDDCGTVPSHKWINTKIILSGADAAYGSTLDKSKDIDGDLITKDGGTTWTSKIFNIPEYTFK